MKKIKYILLSILLSLIYMNNVKASATCVYETSYTAPYQYTITCRSNSNGNASCTIKDDYNQLSIVSNAVSFKIENSCPDKIYISSSEQNKVTSITTSSGETTLSINRSKSTEGTTPSNPTQPTTPDTSAEYENDSRYIQAKADVEKYCNSQDFANQDDAKCEEARKKMREVKALYEDSEGFDSEHFCKGSVQGVFTTLGWVFFIIKIVIPILLIIFGSIDVGKAVIASKDDEIKKSVKTLAVRTVAGIIIFFVPTILNFAVKLIDNSEVYNGTFWDCTKCMLNPTKEVCETLIGGSAK